MLSLRLIPSVVAAVVSRHEPAAVKTLRPQGDKEEGEEPPRSIHTSRSKPSQKLAGPVVRLMLRLGEDSLEESLWKPGLPYPTLPEVWSVYAEVYTAS